MSITTSEMTPADFAAVTGNNRGGGFGDGNGAWWIVLFLIFAMAGWGNGNGFGGGNGGGSATPYVIDNSVQRGFDQSAIMTGIGNVQNGVQGLSTQLCNCCADMQNTVNNGFFGVQNALCNGFNSAEVAANSRQMANMQQIYGLSTQFADCCCENRLASADLKYTIATENCADRYEAAQNTRDIIENANRNNQSILDKLCQLEMDGIRSQVEAKNDKIADLERQLTMSNLAASQTAQTSRILADNAAQTVALEQYLNPAPIPAYVVQNPNCCTTNTCGCNSGCGGF